MRQLIDVLCKRNINRLIIMIFALVFGCTARTANNNNKAEATKTESKPVSQIEKSIVEIKEHIIIYDTLVFTNNMKGKILSEKFKTSESQLKFYKTFINSQNINKLKIITKKHTKTEIKYLGKIKDLDKLKSYDVITNFRIWGIGQMLSPRGFSEVAFINEDKIIIYNLSMPDELPTKIERNILYFTHEKSKIGISISGGLPPILCIPEIGCY